MQWVYQFVRIYSSCGEIRVNHVMYFVVKVDSALNWSLRPLIPVLLSAASVYHLQAKLQLDKQFQG